MSKDHNSRTSTRKFFKPSEESLRKVMEVLKKAGEKGLAFTEILEKSGLSRDTVSRCLKHFREQGSIEKHEGRWRLKPRALPLLDEVEVWLEQLPSLDKELFIVMVERLASTKDELKTEECVKLADRATRKLEEWKGEYEKLEKLFDVMDLLPAETLRPHVPIIKATLKEFLKKCPIKYAVKDSYILSYETLEPKSPHLKKVFPPREEERGEPTRHPCVFTKALQLLNKASRGEKKFTTLMEIFRETLNVDFSPGGLDARAHVLKLIENKKRLLKALIEMFREEKRPELRMSIKDVLQDFDVFTA